MAGLSAATPHRMLVPLLRSARPRADHPRTRVQVPPEAVAGLSSPSRPLIGCGVHRSYRDEFWTRTVADKPAPMWRARYPRFLAAVATVLIRAPKRPRCC